MLRFRVVESSPKRAVLTYHGDDEEYARLEITAPEGGLAEYFKQDAFMQFHIHPEVMPPHPKMGDDKVDAGSVEGEIDEAPPILGVAEAPPADAEVIGEEHIDLEAHPELQPLPPPPEEKE